MFQFQNKPVFGNLFRGNGFGKPSYRSRHALSRRQQRRGLTLAELLIASTIMAMMTVGMASLAFTVETGNRHAKNLGIATQHARVAIGRIERALYSAHTSEQFPGFAVFSETEGSYSFPDTLVIWHPTGTPQDPDGLPRFNELVIFCPNPSAPNKLLEITVPSDTRTVPDLNDESTWLSELSSIKSSQGATVVQLTDLLRSATTQGAVTRGAVRFIATVRPTEDEWTDYKDGNKAWEEIAWVQDIYGSQTGLRQSWCRFELQLMPGEKAVSEPAGVRPIPFFGSAAIHYELHESS